MYRTYRASGKVEWYFYVLLLITLVLPVPVGSGLCLLLLRCAPGTMWEIIALLTCGGILLELACRFCIGMGKVRNSAAAWAAGILSGLAFWYLLFVFGAVFFGTGMEADIFRLDGSGLRELWNRFLWALGDVGAAAGEAQRLLREGAPIRGNTGTVLITLRGAPAAAAAGLLCAGTSLFAGVCFYAQSKEPFCESTKRWCRESCLYFNYIANEQAFLHKLLLGDLSVIEELEPLREVNADYAAGTLYSDEEGGEYYITLENMRRKESGAGKGKPDYEAGTLAEYVRLDRDTGRRLLAMAGNKECIPVAEVEDRKAKLRRAWKYLWRYLLLAGEAVVLMMALAGKESVSGLLSNGAFLFYAAASAIVSAVNFIGSSGKKPVVERTEEDLGRPARQYDVEHTDQPAVGRVYNVLMFAVSFLLLWLCVRRIA